MENALVALSNRLASAVEQAGRAVVAVQARPRVASSGVHWRRDVIVTADHTIRREEDLRVTLPDGRTVPAELAGRDAGTDVAILKVAGVGEPGAALASAESAKPGDLILAVGRSEETGVSATMGVISAVAGSWHTWRGGRIDQYLRLDVSLYPGASGGALVDAQGRIIGVSTSGLSRVAALAIPFATINRVVDELLSKGRVTRGFLGVGLQPVGLPDHIRKQVQRDKAVGLMVLSVLPDGPAGKAGLMLGDVVLALDGKPVADTDDVQAALDAESVGKTVQAQVLRGGALTELSIRIEERPRKEN